MTLATSIHITTPCAEQFAQLAFLKAREIIGIPAEHPFKLSDKGLGWEDGEWIGSTPDGFCSALDVSHNRGLLLTPADYGEGPSTDPPAYVDIRLDTAYGYRGPDGERCDAIHDRIVVALGTWLDEQGADWWAMNEYNGEWHHRSAPYGT